MKRAMTTGKNMSPRNVTVIFNEPRYSPRSSPAKNDTCRSVLNVIQMSKINSRHGYEFQLEPVLKCLELRPYFCWTERRVEVTGVYRKPHGNDHCKVYLSQIVAGMVTSGRERWVGYVTRLQVNRNALKKL